MFCLKKEAPSTTRPQVHGNYNGLQSSPLIRSLCILFLEFALGYRLANTRQPAERGRLLLAAFTSSPVSYPPGRTSLAAGEGDDEGGDGCRAVQLVFVRLCPSCCVQQLMFIHFYLFPRFDLPFKRLSLLFFSFFCVFPCACVLECQPAVRGQKGERAARCPATGVPGKVECCVAEVSGGL